jgi:hypothetical protein
LVKSYIIEVVIDWDARYAQFHPLAYTVKLNIEMSMAELIIKVVKDPNRTTNYGSMPMTYPKSQIISKTESLMSPKSPFPVDNVSTKAHISADGKAAQGTVSQVEGFDTEDGIWKTVSMAVRRGTGFLEDNTQTDSEKA